MLSVIVKIACVGSAIAALIAGSIPALAETPAYDARIWDPTRASGHSYKIEFTTDEGTWMSADLSPDRSTIVFDLLANIYLVSATGGSAKCLTQNSGVALNYQPRFSPDGRHIAFISDRAGQEALWVMQSDGTQPTLVFQDMQAKITEPAWMPDGRNIVATKHVPNNGFYNFQTEIWIFPIDGGTPRQVTQRRADDIHGAPEPSPDGRFIYYHRPPYDKALPEPYQGQMTNLERIEIASGRISDITAKKELPDVGSAPYAEVAPKPSPNGRYLAFVRKIPDSTLRWRGHELEPASALWLRDLTTGADRVLLRNVTQDASTYLVKHKRRVFPDYNWSRDSQEIVLTLNGKLARVAIADSSVTPVPFTALVSRTVSEQVRATGTIGTERVAVLNPRWPTVSPNGKTLIFEAVGRLWRLNLKSVAAPVPLTDSIGDSTSPVELTPEWSADGQWIYYATWDDAAKGHLWRMPAEGGNSERLTRIPGRYLYPKERQGMLWFSAWPGAQDDYSRGLFSNDWDLARLHLKPPQDREHDYGNVEVIARATYVLDGGMGADNVPYALLAPPVSQSDKQATTAAAGAGAISPDGKYIVFRSQSHLFLVATPNAVPAMRDPVHPGGKRISDLGGISFPRWRNESVVDWFEANRLMSYDVRTKERTSRVVSLSVPRAVGESSIALVGARIVTLDAKRSVIEDGVIVIRNGKIIHVGPRSSASIQGVQKVIDIAGATVVPGWFDMHTHYLTSATLQSMSQQYSTAAAYLAYGITTTFDPGARQSTYAFAIGESTAAGRRVGPRVLVAGQYLYGWTESSWSTNDSEIEELGSRETIRNVVYRQVNRGARQLKNFRISNRIQSQMLIDSARQEHVSVTNEGDGLEAMLAMAMDGATGMEHWLQYFPTYSDVTRFLGAAHFHHDPQLWFADFPNGPSTAYWLGQTPLHRDRKLQRFIPWQTLVTWDNPPIPLTAFAGPIAAETAKDLVAAGGYYIVGAHSIAPPIDTHFEMWTAGFAMKPADVLYAASGAAAHMLGLDAELGSIEVGKIADLVVLNSNVLEDIRRSTDIRYTIKDGVVYDAQTADQLWPKQVPYRPLTSPSSVNKNE